jgi:3-hydroxyisobutyrate dehydrogenase-like beta-hydroxyacid dehydrogenase
MKTQQSMQVAIIGLGRLGRALAGRLLEEGHQVRVWNRTSGTSSTSRFRRSALSCNVHAGLGVAANPAARHTRSGRDVSPHRGVW